MASVYGRLGVNATGPRIHDGWARGPVLAAVPVMPATPREDVREKGKGGQRGEQRAHAKPEDDKVCQALTIIPSKPVKSTPIYP
jgi:hypothetical protein